MTTLLHLIANVGDIHNGFTLAAPVIAHVASPCNQVSYSGVDDTLGGVLCGHCLDERGEAIYHATAAHVQTCDYVRQSHLAQARAEIWAEGGYDRWAEGGWDVTGAYSYDPYDR
jgi:hypothetical protein